MSVALLSPDCSGIFATLEEGYQVFIQIPNASTAANKQKKKKKKKRTPWPVLYCHYCAYCFLTNVLSFENIVYLPLIININPDYAFFLHPVHRQNPSQPYLIGL